MLCLCAAQLKFWLQTDLAHENSSSCYRQGRQLLLTFLIMVARWSRATSEFYALIGQNLTGEFMRKIYAASWILFTLTAEADRILCQLVMFLTVIFYWMYKIELQLLSRVFCYSWLVCLLFFWLRDVSLVKVRNPISDGIVFVFHLAWKVWSDTGLTWQRSAFRMVSLSNDCIWCLFFSFFISNLMKSSVGYAAI